MSVYELRDLAILVATAVLPSMFLAWFFAGRRPDWRSRRVILLSAIPVPAMILLLCVAVFITAALSSKEACGVDACGMAMMAATFVAGYALIALGVAVGAAWLVCRLRWL